MSLLFLWSVVSLSVSSVAAQRYRDTIEHVVGKVRPSYSAPDHVQGYSAPTPKHGDYDSHPHKCSNDKSEKGAVYHLHDAEYESPISYVYGPLNPPEFIPDDPTQPQIDGNGKISWARSDEKKKGCYPDGTWSELNFIKDRENYADRSGPQSGGLSFALVSMNNLTGTLRDIHWHSNAHEFFFALNGTGRVTVCKTAGDTFVTNTYTIQEFYDRKCETFVVGPGDLWVAPIGYSHYFEQPEGEMDPLIGLAAFSNTHRDAVDLRPVFANLDPKAVANDLGIDLDIVIDFYPYDVPVRTVYDAPGPEYADVIDVTCNLDCVYMRRDVADFTTLTNMPNVYTQENTQAEHLYIDTQFAAAFFQPNGIGVEWTSRYEMNYGVGLIATEIEPGGTTDLYWTDNADEVYYVRLLPDDPAGARSRPREGQRSFGPLIGHRVDGIVQGSKAYKKSKAPKSVSASVWLEPGDLFMCRHGNVCYIENKGNDKIQLLRFFNSGKPTLSILKNNLNQMPPEVLASALDVKVGDLAQLYAR